MFDLDRFSLIILTRCNLKCRLCCEYVPQNKPFADMTVDEERSILSAFFDVVDHVRILHLTGGGEPFLHPALHELIKAAMEFESRFDRLMLFTNCTVIPSSKLCNAISEYKNKILVQVSRYGINPAREKQVLSALEGTGAKLKIEKYYGEDQSFGGWVDMGSWESKRRSSEELENVFHSCSVTSVLMGNWRTRDGKVHWCSRSQRGMELGYIPDAPSEYVNLFNEFESKEEKQEKFRKIAAAKFICACDYCSGDMGTDNFQKRYPAAEQMRV